MHEQNCFVTLTYSDEFLPAGGSLDRKVFSLFMKRLRKGVADGKAPGAGRVRYYHAGEYGDRLGRPHYHAALFGLDFPDKVLWTVRAGRPAWRSAWLEELWPYGQSELGEVTFESAAYIARYVMKKRQNPSDWEYYEYVDVETGEALVREKEYSTMSLKPGIGKPWLDKFGEEVFRDDSVVVRGRLCKPPRYYDVQRELVDAAGALEASRERRRRVRAEDQTPERLAVRETVAQARLRQSTRGLE